MINQHWTLINEAHKFESSCFMLSYYLLHYVQLEMQIFTFTPDSISTLKTQTIEIDAVVLTNLIFQSLLETT